MTFSTSGSDPSQGHDKEEEHINSLFSLQRRQEPASRCEYGSTSTWMSDDDSFKGDNNSQTITSQPPKSPSTTSSDASFPPFPPFSIERNRCPPFRVNPESRTTEPFRDFDGPFTLYRLFLILWILAIIFALYEAQQLIWPPNHRSSPYLNEWYANPSLAFILLSPLFLAIIVFIGAVSFRFPTHLDSVPFCPHGVVFRIVSKGINNECLMQTIRTCQRVMKQNSYFPYLVEVITDTDDFEAPPDDDVIQLNVPADYRPQNGSLFKARALHYACEASVVPNEAWIVHLDEETHPTSSGVKGIAEFVAKCEQTKDVRRIGQGCILYGRAWRKFKFLTMADMRRTGDDFGYFYLQHKLGFTIFGLHGAYVVCRCDAEKEVGFDLGPHGSITEDAWWALIAMSNGNRFQWIDGYLEEQSTQSVLDFLKQRRRWHYGLFKVVTKHPVRVRFRLSFILFFLFWIFASFTSPLQITYILTLIIHDIGVPIGVRIPTLVIISLHIWSYIIGWVVNVKEGMPVNRILVPFWTVLIILLYPVFQVLECIGLLMGFFAGFSDSGKGFHVVQKSVVQYETHHDRDEETPLNV